jgi:hypothetical protein
VHACLQDNGPFTVSIAFVDLMTCLVMLFAADPSLPLAETILDYSYFLALELLVLLRRLSHDEFVDVRETIIAQVFFCFPDNARPSAEELQQKVWALAFTMHQPR